MFLVGAEANAVKRSVAQGELFIVVGAVAHWAQVQHTGCAVFWRQGIRSMCLHHPHQHGVVSHCTPRHQHLALQMGVVVHRNTGTHRQHRRAIHNLHLSGQWNSSCALTRLAGSKAHRVAQDTSSLHVGRLQRQRTALHPHLHVLWTLPACVVAGQGAPCVQHAFWHRERERCLLAWEQENSSCSVKPATAPASCPVPRRVWVGDFRHQRILKVRRHELDGGTTIVTNDELGCKAKGCGAPTWAGCGPLLCPLRLCRLPRMHDSQAALKGGKGSRDLQPA